MKKDNNSADFKEFLESFNKETLRCPKCNSKRREIKLKDIPNNLRKVFILSMKRSVFKENTTFVYCKKCEVYSMLSSIKTGSKVKLSFS